MSDETTAKFVVGDTLVTVTHKETSTGSTILVTDGEDEWTTTVEQIEDHYTPVSKLGREFVDIVESQSSSDS